MKNIITQTGRLQVRKLVSIFIIILISMSSFGQGGYFDAHTHLSFKHYYKRIPNADSILKYRNTPDIIRQKYGDYNWQEFGKDSRAKKNAKESNFSNYFQTNYSELLNVDGSILCNSFYPWEKNRTLAWHNRLIDHFFASKLSRKRLKTISSDNNSQFNEFLAEYNFARYQNETNNGKTVRFAKDISDLRQNLQDNVTTGIMTIEGGQVLSGLYTGHRKRILKYQTDAQATQEILENVHELKNLPHRLFFVTTSHFSWNRVSGFAKSLDKFGYRRQSLASLSKFRFFRNSTFLKWGEGIHGKVGCSNSYLSVLCSETSKNRHQVIVREPCKEDLAIGREVIKEFLNPNTSLHKKPTLIDTKHMDVRARIQYYELKDSLEKLYNIKIPVIASHTAVSGENLMVAKATGLFPYYDKYQELKNPLKYYKELQTKYDCNWKTRSAYEEKLEQGYNPFDNNINEETAGWFYPWSMNLYDEEIEIIHNSNGIMGIMLDNRQLGERMINYTKAYRAEEEAKFNKYVTDHKLTDHKFNEYYELIPFMRNIEYVARHCGSDICWEHITLGSDFDGLIDPLKICPTAREIPVLKSRLQQYLDLYIKNNDKYELLVQGYDANDIVNKIFYENGKRFTLQNF